jgi:hypothetical protein
MYPGPTGSPENHKKGICSDGASPSLKVAEWPQPHGIFTNGTHFHPIPFLKVLHEIYDALIIRETRDAIPMEHEAFVRLLASRTVVLDNGAVLFHLFELKIDASTLDDLIIDHKGIQHLRLDCLRG